jgi:PLD-like domain
MNAAFQLPESDLPTLIAALRSGRLTAPFTAAVMANLVGRTAAPATILTLEKLQHAGFSEEQIATALELVAQDRQRHPRLEDAIDLVITGPEASGVANRDTRVVVRELFANAQRSVMIAGYAIYQGKSVFQALADRMAEMPTLKVRLILEIQRAPGDTTQASLLVRQFADRFREKQWPQDRPLPEVYYDPRSIDLSATERSAMHAKCIVVDNREVFISSANFTEAAQNRNLEVGVLIRSAPVAENLARHFEALIEQKLLLPAW